MVPARDVVRDRVSALDQHGQGGANRGHTNIVDMT